MILSSMAIAALTSIVPSIAGWVGGDKAEEAAQKIGDVAMAITGIKNPTEAALSLETNERAKREFILQMDKNRMSFDALYLSDKKSAREMQSDIAVNSKSRVAREFVYWYAAIITIMACVYIGCVTFMTIPEGNERFADTALGFILGTIISSIMGFFYGASKPQRDDE